MGEKTEICNDRKHTKLNIINSHIWRYTFKYNRQKKLTHWLITEAKTQEVQCNDPMEALGEWLPDLHGKTPEFSLWLVQKGNPCVSIMRWFATERVQWIPCSSHSWRWGNHAAEWWHQNFPEHHGNLVLNRTETCINPDGKCLVIRDLK